MLLTVLAAIGSLAVQAPKKADSATKYKAIWEPASVKEDLELYSVHFATPDVGWVAGGKSMLTGGVILGTTDGGKTWAIQVGDPESNDRSYGHLRVLSPSLAFAVQATAGGHRLHRTEDGKNWVAMGQIADHRTDYTFLSKDVGFMTYDRQIFKTQDGGRSWKPAYGCKVRVEVGGLTRDVQCDFVDIHFLNNSTGMAVSRVLPDNAGNVIARTEDGGATWKTWVVLPGETTTEGALKMLSASEVVLRTQNGKMFHSADGGQTWNGVSGQAQGKPDLEFANPQLGWMMVYQDMHYTTSGGKSWVSRRIGFPAMVRAFCFVSPDRGYAVGDHGMVFRYRIVPADYTVPGMLPAPAMPATN
jgi:photosystem II stability/assembly factor-like uncharacterized protein